MDNKDLVTLKYIIVAALTVMVLIYVATKFDIAVAVLLIGAVVLLYTILTSTED